MKFNENPNLIIPTKDCLTDKEIIDILNLPLNSFSENLKYLLFFEDNQSKTITHQFETSLYQINVFNAFPPFNYYCEECKQVTGFKILSAIEPFGNFLILIFQDTFNHEIKVILSKELIMSNQSATYKIQKIGQHPIESFKIEDSKKYKEYLSPYQYDNYINAHKARHLNLYIASFLYLRRIFESLLLEVDESALDNERIKDKIKRLINENKIHSKFGNTGFNTVYSILSKHIHELDEKEAEENIDILFLAIKNLIDDQIRHKEEIKAENELSKKLSAINSTI